MAEANKPGITYGVSVSGGTVSDIKFEQHFHTGASTVGRGPPQVAAVPAPPPPPPAPAPASPPNRRHSSRSARARQNAKRAAPTRPTTAAPQLPADSGPRPGTSGAGGDGAGTAATDNCVICMERKRNTTFLCGHICCDTCAADLTVCHMCRSPIERRIRLYE